MQQLYSLFCSWQVSLSQAQHIFDKLMKETKFTPKSVSRIKRNGAQCVHHENEQPMIVVWTTVQKHHRLELLTDHVPATVLDQRPLSSDNIPAAAEHQLRNRVVRSADIIPPVINPL